VTTQAEDIGSGLRRTRPVLMRELAR
jgi:hypothetical protein